MRMRMRMREVPRLGVRVKRGAGDGFGREGVLADAEVERGLLGLQCCVERPDMPVDLSTER